MSAKDGIVHLDDLPPEKVCIKFSDELQKEMVEKALTIAGNMHKLAREIAINRGTLYDLKKSRFASITLKVIINLSHFLVLNGEKEFSLENLEKRVKLIKSKFVGNPIFNPKFPLNFNTEEGAQIISAIFFDGGITKEGYPFYSNKEKFLIDKFIKNVKRVIGNTAFNLRKTRRIWQVELPKTIGYILIYGLGIIPGKKIITNISIPEFILKNLSLYKNFIQQAFDDEGHVNKGMKNGGGKSISLSQFNAKNEQPPIRLVQLKEMIEKFSIKVNGPYFCELYKAEQGYTSYGWVIEISNQAEIRKFTEKIGFSLPRKQKKLEELLNSYKLPPRFKNGTILQRVFEACKFLKEKNEKITNKNIARIIKRSECYTAQLTTQLVKSGKLKIIKDKIPLKGSIKEFEGKEFEVNEAS